MRSRRHAFSTLIYIVITALILMIWGAAQHYTSATVRRRVLIAEAGRRCLLQATTAVEEGLSIFTTQMNEGPPPGSPARTDDFASRARQLRPGEILQFHLSPPVAQLPGGGPDVRLTTVSGRMFVVSLQGQFGEPPVALNRDAYRQYLIKWSRIPGCPADMLTDELKLFGDYRPPTAKGILEFAVTADAHVAGVEVWKTVAVRHQVELSGSPFPDVLGEFMGTGLASMMHVEPIELGRRITSSAAAPPERTAAPGHS